MKLETKFNLGDKVYIIGSYAKKIVKKCNICQGTKKILIKGESINCSKCNWEGNLISYELPKWNIINESPYTIGKITQTAWKYSTDRREDGEEYMCLETGINGGTLWRPQNMFLTIAEAQSECNKRNKLTKKKNLTKENTKIKEE